MGVKNEKYYCFRLAHGSRDLLFGVLRGVQPLRRGPLHRNSETFLCFFLLVTKERRSSRETAVKTLAEKGNLVMSNETNETPVQGRKVGIARFFELLGRDLWPLYKSGILCVLGFLPGTALAVFGMMAGSALLTVVGGVVGGLVGGPFLSGVIDTVLRALRDEPGYWWNTYKRAWKQNWRQSLVPGALLGLFVGSWAWMLRAQAESGNTSTALWVASFAGIFVCTGFFTWLLAQVPLVDLPLVQIAKNAGLMFFGFFPRTAAAALVLALYWGATLLYLPATILTILAFGFWLPVTIALMIVYPGLEKVFKLEETINARRAAEIEERMAQNQPKFDQ